jgi:hypothetical protein
LFDPICASEWINRGDFEILETISFDIGLNRAFVLPIPLFGMASEQTLTWVHTLTILFDPFVMVAHVVLYRGYSATYVWTFKAAKAVEDGKMGDRRGFWIRNTWVGIELASLVLLAQFTSTAGLERKLVSLAIV